MSKDLTAKEISEIPAEILKMLGKPLVLPIENLEVYKELRVQIANTVAPIDVIEWLWVDDILYHTWEIRRLRLVKLEVIKISQDDMYKFFCEKKHITDESKKLSIKKFYRTTDKGTISAFLNELEGYERIDSLLASAEARRNAALHEIERHRQSFARCLRKASEDIIDGVFTEPQSVSAASGQVVKDTAIPVNHEPGKPASAASGPIAKDGGIPADHGPRKPASTDSGQVTKRNLVKKGTIPPAKLAELLKGIETRASHGPKTDAP
jgi:hypothetical protein